eukprot:m.628485 g.628485  ORF g.628485 m.628485 type:complete len:105 (-) comp58261_c0_seq3:83-397(-)
MLRIPSTMTGAFNADSLFRFTTRFASSSCPFICVASAWSSCRSCPFKKENEALKKDIARMNEKIRDHKTDVDEENRELRAYIDRLLAVIMDEDVRLLEKLVKYK